MSKTNRATAYRKTKTAEFAERRAQVRVIVEMTPLWDISVRFVYVMVAKQQQVGCFHTPGDRSQFGDCECTSCGAALWAPEWVGYAPEGYASFRESALIHTAMTQGR